LINQARVREISAWAVEATGSASSGAFDSAPSEHGFANCRTCSVVTSQIYGKSFPLLQSRIFALGRRQASGGSSRQEEALSNSPAMSADKVALSHTHIYYEVRNGVAKLKAV